MILEEIKELPEGFTLGELARREWSVEDERWLLTHSERIWLVTDDRPLFVLGVFRMTLCSTPTVWMLAAVDLKVKYLRELRKVWPAIWQYYDELQAVCSTPQTIRFMEFFGFRRRVGDLYGASKWQQV